MLNKKYKTILNVNKNVYVYFQTHLFIFRKRLDNLKTDKCFFVYREKVIISVSVKIAYVVSIIFKKKCFN